MNLSDKSHKKIERFFRDYFQDESFRLPKITFYGGKFSRFFTSKFKIEGITIGKRVFIFPERFWRGKTDKLRIDEALVVHEIMHVLQYRRDGFFRFLARYLLDYWRNLRRLKKYDSFSRATAYFEIPYEREAREIERKYREWKNSQSPMRD